METSHLLFRRGFTALLGARRPLHFDPQAGRISSGRQILSFGDIRCLEFHRGFLTLGTTRTWLTIDFQSYRDESGPLLERGELSDSARQILETLKGAADNNAEQAAREPPGLSLDLRYRVRVD